MQKITRKAIAIAAGAAAMFTLAGCGGGSNGTYYGAYECPGRVCYDNGRLVRLVIDGDNVAFDIFDCDGVKENDTSAGVFNETNDKVTWTTKGHYDGSTSFTNTADDNVVTLAKTVYHKAGSETAEQEVEGYEKRCLELYSGWTSPL